MLDFHIFFFRTVYFFIFTIFTTLLKFLLLYIQGTSLFDHFNEIISCMVQKNCEYEKGLDAFDLIEESFKQIK